jgi:hypothetical protein
MTLRVALRATFLGHGCSEAYPWSYEDPVKGL